MISSISLLFQRKVNSGIILVSLADRRYNDRELLGIFFRLVRPEADSLEYSTEYSSYISYLHISILPKQHHSLIYFSLLPYVPFQHD